MFCSSCGAQNPDNAKWCGSCGKPMSAPVPPAAPVSPAPSYPPPGAPVVPVAAYGQAPAPVQATHPPYVPSHMGLAVFSTLCCCLPLGLLAIIFAAQVGGKVAAGDIAGARHSASLAKTWAVLAIIGGLILDIVIVLLQIFIGLIPTDSWH